LNRGILSSTEKPWFPISSQTDLVLLLNWDACDSPGFFFFNGKEDTIRSKKQGFKLHGTQPFNYGYPTPETKGIPTDSIEVISGNLNERNDLKPFRLESIDIIRGLAITMMIFTHFFYYSINPALIYNKLIFYVADLASFFSVPLFYFTIGYTLSISIKEKRKKGHSDSELTNYILVRSCLIYILGFVLNIDEVGFDQLWEWSTLQMISVGYIVTYILLKKSKTLRAGLIVVSIMIAFMLAPFYTLYLFRGDWNFTGFFMGFIFSGDDPFFPWIAFFLLGSIIAEVTFTKKNIILICIPLLLMSSVSILAGGINSITKYPASLTYIILFITGTLIIYYGLFYVYEIKNIGKVLFYPLRLLGMFPLTIFLFHIIVGEELIKRFSIYQSLGFIGFLGVFVVTMIMLTCVGFFWEKWEFKYSIDWFLKIVSYKMLKNKKITTKR
jgi:uncharacterized membrane protein